MAERRKELQVPAYVLVVENVAYEYQYRYSCLARAYDLRCIYAIKSCSKKDVNMNERYGYV